MTQNPKDTVPLYQSFMTAPEWKNVEISEDLAEFLSSNKPLHHFVFLREAYDINVIFYHTMRTSLKHNTLKELIFPEHYNYFTMNLFVILMTNISMLASKLYCWFVQLMMLPYTIYAWYQPEVLENKTPFQDYAAKYYQNFVEQLNLMPFYKIDYNQSLQNLIKNYQDTKNSHTWTDFWTYWYIRLEIYSKIMLSQLMKSEGMEIDLTSTTVDFSGEGHFVTALDQAKKCYLEKVGNQTSKNEISIIDGEAFKITTPRYMDFRVAIECLANSHIHVQKLAGQERVLVKLDASKVSEERMKKLQDICDNSGSDSLPYVQGQNNRPNFQAAEFLYSYENGLRTKTFFMMDMPTYHLDKTLKDFESQGFQVKFVHNF